MQCFDRITCYTGTHRCFYLSLKEGRSQCLENILVAIQVANRRCDIATEDLTTFQISGTCEVDYLLPWTCLNRVLAFYVDPSEKVLYIVSRSYLRFAGRLTSPVIMSMFTNLVISIAGCSGHLRENISGNSG